MVLTPAVAMCLFPHVYKSLSYNPQQDFAPGYDHLHHCNAVCGRPDGPQLREDPC